MGWIERRGIVRMHTGRECDEARVCRSNVPSRPRAVERFTNANERRRTRTARTFDHGAAVGVERRIRQMRVRINEPHWSCCPVRFGGA